MHITCVICSDLFTPGADIYTTPCGHIFHYTCLLHWLENSKTCPQCRTKVVSKSLVRLYPNLASSQSPETDVTILQNKLDSLEFTLKLKDHEIKNIVLKNMETQVQNKSLRSQIKELELSEKRFESVVAAHKDQIKYFKGQSQNCNQLKDEIAKLKNEVKNLEQVQVAVSGSRQQVEEIIRNENSVESLALLAATLKKSLIDTDRKRKEYQIEFRKAQNELSLHKRTMTQLKSQHEEAKKHLESLKLSYEKEVSFLKDKFSRIQENSENVNESLNNSIRRITAESPVNYNRTPVHLSNKKQNVDLTKLASPQKSRPLLNKEAGIKDLVEESPLAASSMGIFAIQKSKILGNNADKFSIFKNKQPAPLEHVSTKHKVYGVSYDGLGGSSKEDIYPTSVGVKRPRTTKMISSKFKKLSADAGKRERKISGFISLD